MCSLFKAADQDYKIPVYDSVNRYQDIFKWSKKSEILRKMKQL